jgi:ABC-type lipoprotein release transport system permease subunit
MQKQAAYPDGPVGSLSKGFMENIGRGMAGLTMGVGAMSIASAMKGVKNDQLHNEFVTALRTAIQINPILRQAKKEKVVNYAETIFRFAPNVATDSNLLSSVLANAVHGEGVDPLTLKSLSELESRYKDNMGSGNAFSPKTYV